MIVACIQFYLGILTVFCGHSSVGTLNLPFVLKKRKSYLMLMKFTHLLDMQRKLYTTYDFICTHIWEIINTRWKVIKKCILVNTICAKLFEFAWSWVEVGVRWLCRCTGIVWEPIRKRAHTRLVREHSASVILARWATVEWSWHERVELLCSN